MSYKSRSNYAITLKIDEETWNSWFKNQENVQATDFLDIPPSEIR